MSEVGQLKELEALEVFRRYTDDSGALAFDSPYLLVVARKRG